MGGGVGGGGGVERGGGVGGGGVGGGGGGGVGEGVGGGGRGGGETQHSLYSQWRGASEFSSLPVSIWNINKHGQKQCGPGAGH